MRMIKPFYQGKLDTFCAIYAVLNALRLTHGIRTSKAREILNATLLGISENRKLFEDVLYGKKPGNGWRQIQKAP